MDPNISQFWNTPFKNLREIPNCNESVQYRDTIQSGTNKVANLVLADSLVYIMKKYVWVYLEQPHCFLEILN